MSEQTGREFVQSPIGVFDSGLGGLSVLRELLNLMPNEHYIYYGDSLHAPYGTKSLPEVRDRAFQITEYLLERGIKALVVACNTATSAAIAQIRERYPELVVVGIEPAIKPAITEHPDRDILVLATPFTLREEKFKTLSERFADAGHIISVPSIELVEFVENGDLGSPELIEYLQEKLAPYFSETGRIGAVVLGCTHFPFLRGALGRVLPADVPIYDGGAGTARQTKRCLEYIGQLRTVGAGHVCMINTKEKEEFKVAYLSGTYVSDVPAQGLFELSMKLLLNE